MEYVTTKTHPQFKKDLPVIFVETAGTYFVDLPNTVTGDIPVDERTIQEWEAKGFIRKINDNN